jgi:hypothetical protein
MRVLLSLICIRLCALALTLTLTLTTSVAWASKHEWQVASSFEVSPELRPTADSLSFGGSAQLSYGVEHWLSWELVRFSLLKQQNIAQSLGEMAGARLVADRYRLQLFSSAIFKPPLSAQVLLHHVVPYVSLGLGIRGDAETGRSLVSPSGYFVDKLADNWRLALVGAIAVGLEWRIFDAFFVDAHAISFFEPHHFETEHSLHFGMGAGFCFY